jgi:hypothetical protein
MRPKRKEASHSLSRTTVRVRLIFAMIVFLLAAGCGGTDVKSPNTLDKYEEVCGLGDCKSDVCDQLTWFAADFRAQLTSSASFDEVEISSIQPSESASSISFRWTEASSVFSKIDTWMGGRNPITQTQKQLAADVQLRVYLALHVRDRRVPVNFDASEDSSSSIDSSEHESDILQRAVEAIESLCK